MSDTTAPVLLGLTLPSVIDLAAGNTSFDLGVQVQDEPGGSGVRWVSVEFKDAYRVEGFIGSNKFVYFDDQWNKDNFHDETPGSSFRTLQISDLTRSGSYEIARVTITDWSGNANTYDTGRLQALGIPSAITVKNGLVDTVAPTLVGLKFPASVDLSTGFAQNFEVEGRARDAGGAGVRALTITLDKPIFLGWNEAAEVQLTTELQLTTDMRVADAVLAQLKAAPALSGKAAPGVYNITKVRVTDFQDNARDYSAAELQALGVGTAITVTGNQVEHPPVPPMAALSWAMSEQGVVMTVTPESWGTGPVDIFAVRLQRDIRASDLEGFALTGGATGELSVVEDDYGLMIVGRNVTGIGPGTGISVSMSQVTPMTELSLGFLGFTINGVEHRQTGANPVVDYFRGTDAADFVERWWNLPELMDGGGGLDTLRLHLSRSDYAITQSGDGFLMYRTLSGDAVRLVNIERLAFDDGHVALDTEGAAGQLYRLYQAAFDRAPDSSGFGHWLGRMDAGDSLERIAGYFVASKEFIDLTGAAASDRDFVAALYDNVLHRQPDAAGLDFWVGVLGRGALDRSELLVEFSESPENVAQLVGAIGHGIDYTPP